jgi:dTDP-4-dehydrorhamnose 3,5-epimerase
MSQFEFISTPLAGLIRVQRKTLDDHRGFLSRHYCADEFREAGLNKPIAQINHTYIDTSFLSFIFPSLL